MVSFCILILHGVISFYAVGRWGVSDTMSEIVLIYEEKLCIIEKTSPSKGRTGGIDMVKDMEKRERLAHVAQRYYLEDCKQSDIAKELGVSRPLISRMLKEARELGVVDIKIQQPDSEEKELFGLLLERYHIDGGALVADGVTDAESNRILSRAAIGLLHPLKSKRLGLGWGHFIGEMVNYLEDTEDEVPQLATVCPMIGNSGIPIRHYQSNENVRVFADRLKAVPYFLNLPALPDDCMERDIFCGTESYRRMTAQWERMDTAFVNIGNYPSTPDFASGARYGTLLQKQRACGRIICYFLNRTGEVIQSDQDFALQMPLSILKGCRNVVGLCSANTNAAALEGALNTGLFTHLVVRRTLVKELISNTITK